MELIPDSFQKINGDFNFSPFSLIRETLVECKHKQQDETETAINICFNLYSFMESNKQIIASRINPSPLRGKELVFGDDK